MTQLNSIISRTAIAYFSMEIAIRPEMHTYSGGLGILAGDTARTCADLELRVVFVTLVNRAGYFRQKIDADGRQIEEPDWWDPAKFCTPLDAMVAVEIEGRPVWIRAWLYIHTYPHGHQIPIILLDTDLDHNENDDRTLTHFLYGGGEGYRLKQEIVLGIGGARLLRALGLDIRTYHLNEGHAALLTLELLNRHRIPEELQGPGIRPYDIATVHEQCVFTTHTPVEAGYDKFSYDLFQRFLPDFVNLDELKRLAGPDKLNMTRLAFNLSGYINGVARRHVETTEHIFPGYRIHTITNGVHVGTWAHESFAKLYEEKLPHWRHEPEILVRALQFDENEIWKCHQAAKADLIGRVKEMTGLSLDPSALILGFARRMTGYKRPLLLFSDLDRLTALAARHPFQIVMAGKAHPKDDEGKRAIERVHQIARELGGKLKCVFLPGYDMELAKPLIAGSDVWLDTPLPPMEASGTSGMKAALNGVLNLSTLDGWWVEACIDNVNGWAIGSGAPASGAADDAVLLYEKLGSAVLPLYYGQTEQWRWMMKQAIGSVAYYFNSQRMMRRYAAEAYLRHPIG
jgi:glycogen phosphorylase